MKTMMNQCIEKLYGINQQPEYIGIATDTDKIADKILKISTN